MGQKSIVEHTVHDAKRNADDRVDPRPDNGARKTKPAYVDPAQTVMETNPNPSPPIHPKR